MWWQPSLVSVQSSPFLHELSEPFCFLPLSEPAHLLLLLEPAFNYTLIQGESPYIRPQTFLESRTGNTVLSQRHIYPIIPHPFPKLPSLIMYCIQNRLRRIIHNVLTLLVFCLFFLFINLLTFFSLQNIRKYWQIPFSTAQCDIFNRNICFPLIVNKTNTFGFLSFRSNKSINSSHLRNLNKMMFGIFVFTKTNQTIIHYLDPF